MEDADAVGAMADLDGADRVLAGTHALLEVQHVVLAHGEMDPVGGGFLAEQRRGVGLEAAARYADPAFLADELDPRRAGRRGHYHAVGVQRLARVLRVDVEQAALGELRGRLDLDRAGIRIRAETPLGDVVHVGAPTRDHAATVLLDLQPARAAEAFLRVHAVLRVGGDGRRAHPHVVVQVLRYRHRLGLARAVVGGHADLDGLQRAEHVVADEFARLAEVHARPLLRARLEDHLVLADGGDELLALDDRVGQRLLDVDVLARVGGRDGDDCMLVVGRGDRHAVDVLAGQQLAVVAIHLDGGELARAQLLGVDLLDLGLGGGRTFRVDVADGYHAGVRRQAAVDRFLHVAASHAPIADAADQHRVARRVLTEDGAGDNRRRRNGCGGELHGVTTTDLLAGEFHRGSSFPVVCIAPAIMPKGGGDCRLSIGKRSPIGLPFSNRQSQIAVQSPAISQPLR